MSFFLSTDTPLILFVFLSALLFARASREGRSALYALSGAFLGLAFLSKYFAVLLFAAYVGAALFTRTKSLYRGVVIVGLTALPFVAVNVYWNYGNCWANILFNIIARTRDASFTAANIFTYIGGQVYLMMPWSIYFFLRHRREARGEEPDGHSLLGWCFAVPLAVFALVSVKKGIGLHWMASFYPFFFIGLFTLKRRVLSRILRYTFALALFHVAAAAVILLLPTEMFREHRSYGIVRLHLEPGAVCSELESLDSEYLLASDSYSVASLLSHHCDREVAVFKSVSKYGRADDKFTDFRELGGRNIAVFSVRTIREEGYAPFFDRLRVEQREIEGASYTLALGEGFRYEAYRDLFLENIRDRFYRIPGILPRGDCYFNERYF